MFVKHFQSVKHCINVSYYYCYLLQGRCKSTPSVD